MTTQYLFLFTFVQSASLAVLLSSNGRPEMQGLAMMVALSTLLDLFSRYFHWRSTRKWVFLSAIPAVLFVAVWMMVWSCTTPAAINLLTLLFGGWFWMGVIYTMIESVMGHLVGPIGHRQQTGNSSL